MATAFNPKLKGTKRVAEAVPQGGGEVAEGGANKKFKPKSKDKFSDKVINFLDLEKNDLYKQIEFVKPPGSKMIYWGFKNALGGVDKQIRIRADNRETSSGLKIFPPSGTITTYNTIYNYSLTDEEYEFWSQKLLPHICLKILQDPTLFFSKQKAENLAKKPQDQAIEQIMESMVGER
jgi:hypothetical protein